MNISNLKKYKVPALATILLCGAYSTSFAEDINTATGVNVGPNSEGLNSTDYERRAAEQGIQRDKPWRTLDLGETPVTIRPNRTVGSQQVDARTLTDSWERLNSYQDFTDLRNQVDDHENRLGDLEVRVTNLEDQPGNWQPGAPEPGPSQPIGPSVASDWSPAISTQLADFTQSRTVTQDTQRTVNVYETNVVTGERRIIDTYTETDTQTTNETRLVDVANNPGGGTDGWSGWSNTSGVYNCTGYSPATSTRDQGVRFTQTRRCSQNQERFIYYLPEGDATTERRGTRVASVTQSRSATGTRVVTECRLEEQRNIDNTRQHYIQAAMIFEPSGRSTQRVVVIWGPAVRGTHGTQYPTDRTFSSGSVPWPTEANPFVVGGFEYFRGPSSIQSGQIVEVCRKPS